MRKLTTLLIVVSMVASGFLAALIVVSPEASATVLSPNIKVNDDGFDGVKATVDIAMHDAGRAIVVWDEERFNDRNIYLAYSSDNGTGFSTDHVVNTLYGGSQVSPAVAAGENNEVYVVWQDEKDNNKIYLGKSTDLGLTFQEEVRVSNNDFGYEQWPDVAVNGQTVAVVWRDSGSDNAVRVWNPDTGALVKMLGGHDGAVRGLDYSPSGANLVSCSESGDLIVWDSGSWNIEDKIQPHTDFATAVDWSPDGSQIASSSWDVVEKLNGTGQVIPNPYTGTPTSDIVLLDSATLAVDKVLNETNGVTLLNPVNDVVFSPDGSQIAAAYNGREITTGVPSGNPNKYFNVTVWNTSDWSSWSREKDLGGGHEKSVHSVAFNPNGTMLASCSSGTVSATDYTVKVWNSQNGGKVAEFNNLGTVYDIAWSPNGTYLAAGLSNGTIAMFNYTNYSEIFWMEGHNGQVNGLDWHAASNRLASGASDPKAKVWNVTSRTELMNLTGHAFSVSDLCWAPNGNRVVTGSGNRKFKDFNEYQIYCAVSTDGGASFSDAIPVSDTLEGEKQHPAIAIDGNDTISVVWYDDRNVGDDVWFSNSTDLGASFGNDIEVTAGGNRGLNPDVDVDDSGTAHVVWQWIKNTSPLLYDTYYANSSDNFATSRAVNATAGSQQQNPSVAAMPDGTMVYVTWADNRDGEYEIYLANSTDGGWNFGDAQKVTDPNTDDKYSTNVAVDKYGHLGIAWPDNRDGIRSVYYTGSQQVDATAPTIVSVSPPDGSTNSSIFTIMKIQFSEPMNKDSVENAFSFSDGASTFDADDCHVTWSGYGDVVNFEPNEPLEYETTYTATLNTGPMDRNTFLLASGISWTFSTGSDLDPPEIMPEVNLTIPYHVYTIDTDTIEDINYDYDVNITARIVDYLGDLASASLFYKGVGASVYTELAMTAGSVAGEYEASIPAQWALGNVTFYIRAEDLNDNDVKSGNYTYNVVDLVKPVLDVSNIKESEVNVPITVTAEVSDFDSVDVKLFYKTTGLDFESVNMTATRATHNYTATIPARSDIGITEYYVRATDASDNTASSTTMRINILDLEAPTIILAEPQNQENKDIFISANVTDNVAVNEVNLYFKAVGSEIWVKRGMILENGTDDYTYTIPAQTKSGTIYYYVNATDTSGNTASTLDNVRDFGHEWPVKGTNFDWTPYILVVVIAAIAAMAYTVFNKSRGKEPREDDWLGPVGESNMAPAREGETAAAVDEGAADIEANEEEGRLE